MPNCLFVLMFFVYSCGYAQAHYFFAPVHKLNELAQANKRAESSQDSSSLG